MNRKDYRKLMEQKKRNKTYAKGIVLATLGFGIGLANSTTTHAESREWKANTSTTIKNGDKEYRIIWGDTLSLISKDSGITMETLANLNNILNYDLIFEGNIIGFGNGATATVKDSNGNIIAETPLTEQDKTGIKEAQKKVTNKSTSQNSVTRSTTGTTNKKTSSNNNNVGLINAGKNNNNNENNSNSGNTGGTTNPIKPVDPTPPTEPTNPVKPIDPTKPSEEKMLATRTYFDVDTEEYFGTDTLEVILVNGKAVVKANTIPQGYKLAEGETGVREVSKAQSTASFSVEKIKDVTPPVIQEFTITINHVVESTGEVLSSENRKAKEGTTVNAQALNFEDRGYELIGSETQSIVAGSNQTITFLYKKVEDENPYVPVHTISEETKVITTTGEYLGTVVPQGYTVVSTVKDNGTVTTATNGDSNTHYVTTITVTKDNSNNGGNDDYQNVGGYAVGEVNGQLLSGLGNSGIFELTKESASIKTLEMIGFNNARYDVYQAYRIADGTWGWTTDITFLD